MRIIVMSDSHGDYFAVEEIIQRNLSADMFIHLGDGERELDKIVVKYPYLNIYHVKGNCDCGSFSPDILNLNLEYGHKLIAVHGHNHAVKYDRSLEILKKAAKNNNSDIILYGHTHARDSRYDDGIFILNPGSASCPRDGNKPSFALIDITPKGIVTNIADLR
ncbi:MAG: metallophosphoesterase family protein [Oscillospiraceae bacterium]